MSLREDMNPARVVPSRVFSLSESCTKERRHEDIVFFV